MNLELNDDLIYKKDDEYLIKNSNEFRRKLFEKLHGISSKFKIDYAINPLLKYEYPELNPIILENIINALIACPRFYIQTLHLMNKMNLPCPLVNYVRMARPSEFRNLSFSSDELTKHNGSESVDKLSTNVEHIDMSTSESESEIETEANPKTIQKRQPEIIIESQPKKIKVKSFLNKLEKDVKSKKDKNLHLNIEQVFEKPNENNYKLKQKLTPLTNLKKDDLLANRIILESEFEGFSKMAPLTAKTQIETISEHSISEESDKTKFISQNDLEKNRLKIAEFKELPVFKNYERGEPNSRLYIKNISKKAQETDLKYIYGRYINWQDETQCNAFDIRLMKEGRMKGQAFLSLPNEQIAEKALNDTNGYLLDEKPLVVQFARSSKPK